jgi:nucleotide-binding universal stress UspA family protein
MKEKLYKKILACYDSSLYSSKAIKHAVSLARTYDAKLYVIYVVEKTHPVNFLDRKEYLELVKDFGKKILERKVQSIKNKEHIAAEPILKQGNVADEIIKFAKNERCDLIVVGSKGFGAMLRFFLGSIANRLATHGKTPVLIVK